MKGGSVNSVGSLSLRFLSPMYQGLDEEVGGGVGITAYTKILGLLTLAEFYKVFLVHKMQFSLKS